MRLQDYPVIGKMPTLLKEKKMIKLMTIAVVAMFIAGCAKSEVEAEVAAPAAEEAPAAEVAPTEAPVVEEVPAEGLSAAAAPAVE